MGAKRSAGFVRHGALGLPHGGNVTRATRSDAAEVRARTATIWNDFCDDLKRASSLFGRAQTPADEQTQAEGLRFLMRLIRIGFENAFEVGDPRHPGLIPMIDAHKVYEGVTGDARYQHAFIDGTATHRIGGTRGDAPLMEFSAFTGKGGLHEVSHQVAALTERELVVGPDGRLEVVFSPHPHPGNWIETGPTTRYLMVREYAHDWTDLRRAELRLEREDVRERRPSPTVDEMQRALSTTAAFVTNAALLWADISDYWAASVVNRFVAQTQVDQKTDIAAPIGHQFSCGWLRLEPGEVLVARFTPKDVPYWSLGVANYWYETLGFREPGSELNNRNVEYAEDGSVEVVIGPFQPRGPNWVDTRDHREGTLIFRWSRSVDPPPEFETEIRRVDDASEARP